MKQTVTINIDLEVLAEIDRRAKIDIRSRSTMIEKILLMEFRRSREMKARARKAVAE
jgi:metal-responsive CopG/Arc/MetJ family transcriptional regulator